MAAKRRKQNMGKLGVAASVKPGKVPVQSDGSLKRWQNIILLLLPVIFLGIYAGTLDHPFYFDDTSNIINNPHIRLN